jgi:predicted transposase YdaD
MMIGTYFPGRGTMIEKAFLEGEAKGKAEGKAEGEAEAKAQSIVRILQRRNITVSPDTEQTIMECKDLAKLDLWFDRALTATQTEDLFTAD